MSISSKTNPLYKPSWMETGRIHHTGVPEKLAGGRFITSRDRLRFAKKTGERRSMQEWMDKYLKKGQLSPWQKKCGARKVA